MSEISERLQTIIDERFNRRASSFAVALGISPTTLANYLNPKRASKPSSDILQKIVESTGVNALWLLTGNGEPFANAKTEIHTNSDNDINGSNNKIGSDNNNGNANGRNSKVINNPCPDDRIIIENLAKEVKNLNEKLDHKDIIIAELRSSASKQDERIKELNERISELKERIEELKSK